VEFSESVGDLVTKYDSILILGDLNVHLCCPSERLTTEFLNIIDSFKGRVDCDFTFFSF